MASYTDQPGLEEVVLEESYVLAVRAEPGTVTLEMEFRLTERHPAYAPPLANEVGSWLRGSIVFRDVRRLVWERQSAIQPTVDPDGSLDYGCIDSSEWDAPHYQLEGDWGRIVLTAGRVCVDP